MKAIENQIFEIMQIVESERLISNRISKLRKLGYSISEVSMGSGGVGQVKELSDRYRVQICYGHGKYNYANVVTIYK